MFPEDFVARQLFAYTRRGDVVFDPFCGRGTTIFESLLNGRRAAGVDINPVAAC
jgi:DNA modification methylase